MSHAAAHVGNTRRDPDPCSCRECNHERRLLSTARTIAASTLPSRRIRTLPGSSICIDAERTAGAASTSSALEISCSSATRTGNNCMSRGARGPRRPDSYKRRHLNTWLAFTPCFIATRATEEPASSVSSTISRRSSALRLRRGDRNDNPPVRAASDMKPSSRNPSTLYTRPTPRAYAPNAQPAPERAPQPEPQPAPPVTSAAPHRHCSP